MAESRLMLSRAPAFPLRCRLSLLALSLAITATPRQRPEPALHSTPSGPPEGMAIVSRGGYPELRVDGKPFFLHSAAFFYDRIPRGRWEQALDRHRALGINTLDLYIPWNWHEPKEGQLDFDGHTNRQRDLRGLLKLIAEKGFRLIARPGPVILNEWRNGGYPEWLLERPEYKMPLADRLEGLYPPLSYLNVSDAEASAQGWLDNSTHMAYAQKWLSTVAKELAPYSARHRLRVASPADQVGKSEEQEISGPLLFVALDDDLAIGRTNRVGPAFWRYASALRDMLTAGGLDVPCFISPTDMRVSAAGFGLPEPIGAMGQWYMSPRGDKAEGARTLGDDDAATIEFYVEELKTQPTFPPAFIEYQAGWYCPADDSRPVESPAANTLLSSRLALAHGLHGLSYFPAEDTYFPAGYEVPWANRYYRWDAALDPNGDRQPRARSVQRNGQLIAQWGEFLASSHKRADFGLVYPLGGFPQDKLGAADVLRVSQTVMRIERVGQLAGLASEVLDPQYQPVEQFLRNALVLLPVFDPGQARFTLSERAQEALVEYVRRGGTLVYFPTRPAGDVLAQLWKGAAPVAGPAGSAVTSSWSFGAGRVVESSKDFYSWASPEENIKESSTHLEARWSAEALRSFLGEAQARPVVKPASAASRPVDLVITELVSNEGTSLLGARTGGSGLLSVTNLSDDQPFDGTVQALSPRAGVRGPDSAYLPVSVLVPPRESLLLPLEYTLCADAGQGESCDDAIVTAGAELLGAERKGKTLELRFYTPSRASVLLRLLHRPAQVTAEEMNTSGDWDDTTKELDVRLFRGASPDFLRTLEIHLPYKPFVAQGREPPPAPAPEEIYSVADAIRLPLADDASLETDPPLLPLDENLAGHLLVQSRNNDKWARDLDVRLTGPVRGSGTVLLNARSSGIRKIDVRPPAGQTPPTPGPDGLLHGQLETRTSHGRRTSPIAFVVLGQGMAAYQFDFDGDGSPEWVLETSGLRLVVSPEAGGQAIALVDKATGLNLTTSVGALRDHFRYAENPAHVRPSRARGRYGLFNRPYQAEWVTQNSGPALRLRYDAPDVFPAGATVEKTIRAAGALELQADYFVRLKPRSHPAGPAGEDPPQGFVAVNSVPVVRREDTVTRFCWAESGRGGAKGTGAAASGTQHCEKFAAGRAPLELPAATELQILTPGRPGLALHWEGARMTIEMKNFSALLKLNFPPLEPGGAAGHYRVGYRILAVGEGGGQ